MDIIFEPFVGLGSLKFGISKSEVESVQATMGITVYCDYQEGNLSSFTVYPSDLKNLFFCGKDILQMGKLTAALYFAKNSVDYGQAQGGSLYFMDLGCAILQFESSAREFLFFARRCDIDEPLRKITPLSIESYYKDQTSSS
jgi:hypothetical protein